MNTKQARQILLLKDDPTYEEICTGKTGHAEVAQIRFDNTKISLAQIFNIFWQAHDPTTINRQGNDIGTQYRSVIFYHNNEQKSNIIVQNLIYPHLFLLVYLIYH